MLELLEEDADYLLGAFGDIVIVIWRRAPTVSSAARFGAALNAFAPRHGMSIGMLVVVQEGTPMPDAAAREKMARDMKRNESFTRAQAMVYEGKGFMAATLRAVVAGMQMLSRQVIPSHVFGSVDDAGAWLLRQGSAEAVRLSELTLAVATLRDDRSRARRRAAG